MSRPDIIFAGFMHCLRSYARAPEAVSLIQTGFGGGQWNITDPGELHESLEGLVSIATGAHHLSVDMSTVPEAAYRETIDRTPYPVMLLHYQSTFEDNKTFDTMLIVVEDEEHECTLIIPFLRTDLTTTVWLPYMFRVQVNWNNDFIADGDLVCKDGDTTKSHIAVAELPGVTVNAASNEKMQYAASEIYHVLDDVLVLINCANVELEAVEPTRLKIARAKKKGTMVERYSTIKLPGHSATYKGGAGGSHASPTLHTRRGHYRRHRTDHSKRSWVRPCVVGDLGEGVTHSEYKV